MEIEAKFSTPDVATLERLGELVGLAGFELGGREVADMTDTYLDTDERDLQAAGLVVLEKHCGFPADIHARLYLPADPAVIDHAPDWATQLHDLATELGEWQRLRLMCARNGFAAGIAAEAMLEQLLPHVPDRHPAQPSPQPDPGPGDGHQTQQDGPGDLGGQQHGSGQGGGRNSPQNGSQDPGEATAPTTRNASDMRASLRRAVRAARDAVHQAERREIPNLLHVRGIQKDLHGEPPC